MSRTDTIVLPESLAPGRPRPTSVESLVQAVSPAARSSVQHGLVVFVEAVSEHFPENLFLDLDRVAGTLEATFLRDGAAAARDQSARFVRLLSLFGGQTAIRFRYVHDFLYGFDWARWVAREPDARAQVGPFDRAFLDYSEQRARELLALIARADPKYHALGPREHRNPFPFRRDPKAEHAILVALAIDGEVPVPAWCMDLPARWDRPFQALREARARALGYAPAE